MLERALIAVGLRVCRCGWWLSRYAVRGRCDVMRVGLPKANVTKGPDFEVAHKPLAPNQAWPI